ncbi:MFS transporter [Curtobacterium sp. SL109]|uniref:MFS transporter n=1 Tax=Curtobacterium sp. SL109 TaxID=2994662 RepID=UPI0022754A6D|nr:MFS transporter [Curtobacterium sp. SL109]MCY1693725.1 MFS transporter [Curtobacterium sp. SL109]
MSFVIDGAAGAANLTAASAPSPLYPLYQQLWGFSSFTLTLIFAVYVIALLVALLTVGSLSDRVGRRPVAIGALVLLTAGMLLFATASGTGGLITARVVQGFAVGAATGTITAMIMDTAPNSRAGSMISSAVPPLGIAIGAVLAGALVEYAPFPRQLVFLILAGVYVLLAILVAFVPERPRAASSPRNPLWRSLVPSVGLPAGVRPIFFALIPSVGATWALAGLYLSLGSSVIGKVLGVHSHLVVGIILGVFFSLGIIGTAVSAAIPEKRSELVGYGTLGIGVLVTIVATSMSSLPLYVAGSMIAGFGFGAAFRYAVNALGDVAPADERGQTFATMYVVSYVAFSIPALAAGLAVERIGLQRTAIAYGVMEILLIVAATAAGIARARRQKASAVPQRHASAD